MRTIQYIEELTRHYNFWLSLYKKLQWRWIYSIAVKLYQNIQDVYDANPGLEAAMKQIIHMREQILNQFSVVDLLTMNKPVARKHVEKLVKEYNDANNILKPVYEKVIHKTIRELRSLGIHLHVHMPQNEDWTVAQELQPRNNINVRIRIR